MTSKIQNNFRFMGRPKTSGPCFGPGPAPFTMNPRIPYNLSNQYYSNHWYWFKVWGILVLIIVITCICITITQRPMDKNDFMQYITKRSGPGSGHCPSLSPISQLQQTPLSKVHSLTQGDANMYALTHRAIDLSDLSESQLLHLPTAFIPEPLTVER